MSEELGCASSYQVLVTERCEAGGDGMVLADLSSRMVGLEWGRIRNGVSVATVTLEPGCCELLRHARQARDLQVFRDGKYVWGGELMADPADCRDSAQVFAADRWGILMRRVIDENLCYRAKCGSAPKGALRIAQDLFNDAAKQDSRCLSNHLEVVGTDARPLEREYKRYSQYTLDAINDLAGTHIDYTAHGDLLILSRKGVSLGQTATLRCDHFAGDVCIGSGGAASATRVILVGDGVVGVHGGEDPYYGMLTVRLEDDSVKSQEAANQEARARWNALRPPVWWLDMSEDTKLSSDAPVSIDMLVPGVRIPVELTCLCTPVRENMELVEMKVTFTPGSDSDSGGEEVSLKLVSPNEIEDEG